MAVPAPTRVGAVFQENIMALLIRFAALPVALGFLLSAPAQAADNVSFSAKARAGVEYQSNVNISELEQASGRADIARLVEAELNTGWQASSALRFDGGYSIQDKNYRQSDDFDTQLHLAFIDAGYQLGRTTIGANLYYARANLESARFLTLQQVSVYSMHSINESWFVRPALTVAEKQFARFSERDAQTQSATLDSFWFFSAGQRFISVGLQYEQENSRERQFSYQAPGLSLKVSSSYTLWQLPQKLQLGAKLSQRDYNDVATQPSTRKDTHTQLEARWQLDFTPHIAMLAAVEHGDFSSSYDAADYRETRSALSFQLSF
jgi:hypothetical protein